MSKPDKAPALIKYIRLYYPQYSTVEITTSNFYGDCQFSVSVKDTVQGITDEQKRKIELLHVMAQDMGLVILELDTIPKSKPRGTVHLGNYMVLTKKEEFARTRDTLMGRLYYLPVDVISKYSGFARTLIETIRISYGKGRADEASKLLSHMISAEDMDGITLAMTAGRSVGAFIPNIQKGTVYWDAEAQMLIAKCQDKGEKIGSDNY
jgi:hypothetical protein